MNSKTARFQTMAPQKGFQRDFNSNFKISATRYFQVICYSLYILLSHLQKKRTNIPVNKQLIYTVMRQKKLSQFLSYLVSQVLLDLGSSYASSCNIYTLLYFKSDVEKAPSVLRLIF